MPSTVVFCWLAPSGGTARFVPSKTARQLAQLLEDNRAELMQTTLAIGPLGLSAHTAAIALALASGLVVLWRVTMARGLNSGLAFDAALAALLVGLAAGRLERLLADLSFFLSQPSAIWQLETGGIGQRSVMVAGTLAFLAIAAWRRPTVLGCGPTRGGAYELGRYGDALAPAVSVSSAVLWIGAALTGVYAGTPASSAWAVSLPDQYGVMASRIPVQPVMAAAHLLLGMLAYLLARSLRPGLSLCLWASATASLAALLDGFVANTTSILGALPRPLLADAALALIWLLAGVGLLLNRCSGSSVPTPAGSSEPVETSSLRPPPPGGHGDVILERTEERRQP